MQYDVFISYSREDSIVVDEIYQAIQSVGLNCFVDRVNIPVGANYVDYLRFAIKQCKVFLYIASRNSHNSKWGYYELSEFLKEKGVRKLFVYAIDDSACPRDLLNEIDSKSIRKRKSVNGDGISDIELSIQLFQAAQGIIIENVNSELEHIDTNRTVFISHSHSDNAVAEDVYNYLSKNGIKCWIDLHHIPAGIPYAQAIMNGLQSSDTMVVLYSKNVIESHDMLDELQEAHTTKKRIIPFLLDKTPLLGQFRYYLARRQWINASQTYQRSLNELVLALKG